MSQAFIIEVFGCTAGILAKEQNRFRFYASHPLMKSLEGRLFKSPRGAEVAAEQIAAIKLARCVD
ncbi:MAG: hypothetical protein JWM91_5302 [Rhodospirillales bacterium]|nr:hypothetical protein [Rhodospirillales bacterium]